MDDNNVFTLNKIIRYLKELDADIICLQEVLYNQFALLKQSLKVDGIFAANINKPTLMYGIATLSKNEILYNEHIFLKSKEVIRVRLKQNGVVEEAKINKLYPSRVEIEITERSKRFQIKTQSENYIYIDEQGYILECTSEKLKLPVITGMEIIENEANNSKRLNDKNLDIMENILQIYQECKKIKIDEKITEIQVNDEYVLKLEQDGIAINLGNATNLKDRMYFVKKLLEEEKENKGTIYVNGNLNEGFSPYFSAIQ